MATSGMSREEIAALMEEKRQTNARRRAEQSAKNAAIEARLAAGGGLSSDNPYASGGTSAPGGAAGAAAPVVAPKVAALSGFSGVVSAITPERGFGFLKSDSGGGDQTWFHISSIMGMGEGRVDASTIAVGTQATWSETPSPTQKGKMMAVEINLATPPGVMAAQRGGGRGGGDRGMGGGMTAQQQQQMQQQQQQQQQQMQQMQQLNLFYRQLIEQQTQLLTLRLLWQVSFYNPIPFFSFHQLVLGDNILFHLDYRSRYQNHTLCCNKDLVLLEELMSAQYHVSTTNRPLIFDMHPDNHPIFHKQVQWHQLNRMLLHHCHC